MRFAPTVDGKITSVRFFKGPNNTGTHTGALWTVGGTQLATGTFTNESTTGWQTLTFDAPVSVTKNVEYVASYRTTVGKTPTRPATSPTTCPAGRCGWRRTPARTPTQPGFPGAQVGTNYLVDVVFERNAASLSAVERRPAADATGAARDTTVDLWVSAPLAAGGTMQVVRSGQPIAGSTSLGGGQQRLSFTPDQPLPADSLFTVDGLGLVSQEGATLPTQTWSFRTDTTADGALAQTVHGNVLPASEGADESDAIELGMAFTPTVDGLVSGVRFFKDYRNTGTHIGTLWTSTGSSLGTVDLPERDAVGLAAGDVRRARGGHGRDDLRRLLPRTRGALRGDAGLLRGAAHVRQLSRRSPAPRAIATAPGEASPRNSFGNPSYFVDVEFSSGRQPLAIASRTPAADATGVDEATTVSVTFSEAIGTGHTLALSVGGTPVAGLAGPVRRTAGR